MLGEYRGDKRGEVGLGEFAQRHVDKHTERQSRRVRLAPLSRVPDRGAQHVPAECDDHPALLCNWDEVIRMDPPQLRMTPTSQCLDREYPAVGQGDDRLVVDLQLLVTQRVPKPFGECDLMQQLGAKLSIEDLDAALAGRLDPIPVSYT